MDGKLDQSEQGKPMPPIGKKILSPAALESIRPYAEEVSHGARTTIVQRGDPARAFYLIVSGRAEVVLGQDDRRLPLARLGPGDSFGEMSLLTGQPVSADVITETDATFLCIAADRFQDALATSASLRNHILARLCENLRRTSSEAWDLFQHAQALGSLMQVDESDEPLIAESAPMAGIQQRISQVAEGSGPILITGEPGTGKFFLAGKIHQATSRSREKPIIVDCRHIENQGAKVLFGASEIHEFSPPDPQAQTSDLRVQGAMHLAHNGCLILRHLDALDLAAQGILATYIETSAARKNVFPQTRLLATTTADMDAMARDGRCDARLADQLRHNVVEMPPLRQRKRDILPLAKLFLDSVGSEEEPSSLTFTELAAHALLSGNYQHHNVLELRESIELAATFAQDGHVDAEHIFTGPKAQGYPVEYDLMPHRLVQWLIKRSSLRWLQGIVLALFLAITVICLTAGNTLIGRIANTLVWAAWWPALLILFLFIGRLWCTVCPISAIGRIFGMLGSLKLAPPAWIKNHTGWIMAFLFLVIVWAERVFQMTHTPMATAILLVSFMLAPILFCFTFQREVWCRYLCPLGSLAASYAVCSAVRVHANPNVCGSQCTSHECFKGSQDEPGCPVYHHPLYARDSHFCKLCLTCLRSCPHQSARLYLRPPFQDLWRLPELGKTLVTFALVVFFVSIVMLSAHRLTWTATDLGFTLAIAGAALLAFIFNAALGRLFNDDKDPALLHRVAFTMLILAWGPFMAFHLDNIPELDTIVLRAADGSAVATLLNNVPISLTFVSQLLVIVISAICTSLVFWLIRVRSRERAIGGHRWGWMLLLALCAAYFFASIGLISPQGIFS